MDTKTSTKAGNEICDLINCVSKSKPDASHGDEEKYTQTKNRYLYDVNSNSRGETRIFNNGTSS